ncbi:hypothetical protein [Pseudomonas sp. EMN2]|uniref:hypothetical protein n=1 Tax=Pseudomonas sp. EMN2 TaxID=2615212 RepID=UPI00129B01DC|nr:hypothetical protein [Pseudomonas sp. EMN2]
MVDPTKDTYAELSRAYRFYNEHLFEGRLPLVMITLQRKHNSLGHFSANQFVPAAGSGDFAHEISLNPVWFALHPIPRTLSILAREMVALDQYLNSHKPPRRRYRNGEWADMCEAIGLMPSETGMPGGKRTGENVDVYIIDGGKFDQATTELVDTAFRLSWLDRYTPAEDDPLLQHTPAAPAMDLSSAPTALEELTQNSSPAALVAAPLLEEVGDDASSPQEFEAGTVKGEGGSGLMAPAPAEVIPISPPAPADDAQPRMKVFARAPLERLQELGIERVDTAKKSSKTKFCCTVPKCKGNAWGKPSLRLGCFGTEKHPHEMRMMVIEEAGKPAPQGGTPDSEEDGEE